MRGEPREEAVARKSLAGGQREKLVLEQVGVGGGLHEGLDGGDEERRRGERGQGRGERGGGGGRAAFRGCGCVFRGGEGGEEVEALGGQFVGEVGLAGEDFEGGEEGDRGAGVDEAEEVGGVVGFVEVGGDDEHGPAQAPGDGIGQDQGARAPLPRGGDVPPPSPPPAPAAPPPPSPARRWARAAVIGEAKIGSRKPVETLGMRRVYPLGVTKNKLCVMLCDAGEGNKRAVVIRHLSLVISHSSLVLSSWFLVIRHRSLERRRG